MEFQFVITAPADSHPFEVSVEPEAMSYAFPAMTRVVLTFRSPDAMTVELTHLPDGLIIWRPADTEVWATVPRPARRRRTEPSAVPAVTATGTVLIAATSAALVPSDDRL